MNFPTNILGSLDLARRALIAHQTALDTIGHNLSNVNTPGYTRQRAELVPVEPRGGVDVSEIRRIRDRFVDFSLLNEQQAFGRADAQATVAQRVQHVFNDPAGTGLSAMLDTFFQSLQDLSVSPTDQVARVTVKDQGQRLASTLNTLDQKLRQIESDLTVDIQQRVSTANGLLGDIADLHRQIIAARNQPAPNDLLDRRDQLVAQLTQIIGVTPLDRPDGTVQLAVTGSGVLLVDGTSIAPLSATVNGATGLVELRAGVVASVLTPKTGALAAVLEARNSPTGILHQAMSDLDTLAHTIATQVNRVHASGSGLLEFTSLTAANAVSSAVAPLTAAGLADTPVSGAFRVIVHDATGAVVSTVPVTVTAGVTTLDDVRAALDADANLTATITSGRLSIDAAAGTTFTFAADSSDSLLALGLNTFFVGTEASTLAVNPVIANNVSFIAAARADAADLVHPGDGANALALAGLRTRPVLNGGTVTFTDFFGTSVGRVGSATRDAQDTLDRQTAAVQVVTGFQQQVSGVSTDEELIALSQAQTAYAAAARFATTINDLIGTLLLMGTAAAS